MTNRIRYMRLIVFFDLPVGTSSQRKNYAQFVKFLKKNGYLMMQESVYSKLAINDKVASSLVCKLRENKPDEGLVQVLKVTEHQYAGMQYIVGGPLESSELDDTNELVIL